MIKVVGAKDGLLKVKVSEKICEGDFDRITKKVDATIEKNPSISILLDASGFNGWASLKAFKEHLNFALSHHKHVHSIAVIPGHFWQYCLVGTARLFVHPKIKTFSIEQKQDAEKWLKQKNR